MVIKCPTYDFVYFSSSHTLCTDVISFISEYAPIFTGKESFYGSMMRSSPMGILLPRRFPGCENLLERIWNFKPRKDDIWIVTYAKSGTTLTQVCK